MKIFLFLTLFFCGCASKDILQPNPSGFTEKDFWLQGYFESQNIAHCYREQNIEQNTDGFICLETGTDYTYYVPFNEWDSKIKFGFVRYSKEQIDQLLAKLNFFCDKVPQACVHNKPETLPELLPFRLRKE